MTRTQRAIYIVVGAVLLLALTSWVGTTFPNLPLTVLRSVAIVATFLFLKPVLYLRWWQVITASTLGVLLIVTVYQVADKLLMMTNTTWFLVIAMAIVVAAALRMPDPRKS
jgi:hypothetical protein